MVSLKSVCPRLQGLVVLLAVVTVGGKSSKSCGSNMKVNDTCVLSWELIHPTQYTFGAQEVREKSQKFSSMHSSELADYLKSNPVPCIQGLNGGFYAIDHHHLVRALSESDVHSDDKVVHVTVAGVIQDNKTPDAFWQAMVQSNWVW